MRRNIWLSIQMPTDTSTLWISATASACSPKSENAIFSAGYSGVL